MVNTKSNKDNREHQNTNVLKIIKVAHYKDIISNAFNWFISNPFRRYDLFYGDKYFERIYHLKPWQQVFVVAEEPGSCLIGLIWSYIIMILTLLSCLLYILGSIRDIKVTTNDCTNPVCSNDSILCPNTNICEPIDHPSITALETFCAIVFTIDYFLRTVLCGTVPSRLASMSKDDYSPAERLELQVKILDCEEIYEDDREYSWYVQFLYYILKPIHLVDIMAILPFLINTSYTSRGMGILKIFRVFRLIKVVKSTVGLQIMINTFLRAKDALQLLVFFSFLGLIFFASLSFFIEKGTYTIDDENGKGYYIRPDVEFYPERSPYESIPVTMYWAVVTMCTVGYGDIYPTGDGGRFVACICMYAGLLVFALPISVIGSNFEKLVDDTKGATAELLAESVLELIYDHPDLMDDLLSPNIDNRLFDLAELKKNMQRKSFFFDSGTDNDHETLLTRAARKERYRLEHLAKIQVRKLATLAILGRGLLSTDTCNKLNTYLGDLGIENVLKALDDPTYDYNIHFDELFNAPKSLKETSKDDTKPPSPSNPIKIEERNMKHSYVTNSKNFKWNGINLLLDLHNLHENVGNQSDHQKKINKIITYESL